MTKPIARDYLSQTQVEAEIIELCVRWYITYRLSYRDLAVMDGRARPDRFPHHDHASGCSIRAGVRGITSAQAFFCKALGTHAPRWPR